MTGLDQIFCMRYFLCIWRAASNFFCWFSLTLTPSKRSYVKHFWHAFFPLYRHATSPSCQKCCKYSIFGMPFQIIFSVFVRGVIWHQTEGYNCNIMSQILSFLTNVTALPVGSISSSHTKISAIYWYYFLVWILIPLDGAATDGDMLSIVLYLRRTFLARLLNHICIHFRHDIAIIPLLVSTFSSYKEWEYDL